MMKNRLPTKAKRNHLLNTFANSKNHFFYRRSNFAQKVSFLFGFCLLTLFSPPLLKAASFTSYIDSLTDIKIKVQKGELSQIEEVKYDPKLTALLETEYRKIKNAAQADSELSDLQKDYISAYSEYMSANAYTVFDYGRKNKKIVCERLLTLQKNFSKTVDEIDLKEAKKELNQKFYSDVYRLLGDIEIGYGNARCVNTFRMIRYFMSGSENYKQALNLDENNFFAQMAFGIYRYYAPKIGGGDLGEAEKHFKKMINEGDELIQYLGHNWLSQVYYKRSKKKDTTRLQSELAAARNIYPKGKFTRYLTMMADKGLYIGEDDSVDFD